MEIAPDSFYIEPYVVQFLIEKGYPGNSGNPYPLTLPAIIALQDSHP
ncbi:hypothetical protein [Sinomicrobium sp. M5D2P9]